MRNMMVFIVCMIFMAFGAIKTRFPSNSMLALVDTITLDSTEVKYSKAFWFSDGGKASLLLECEDTSAVGNANDSASARVEITQGFNLRDSVFVMLGSHATDSILWDSLDILDMDTNAVYVRQHSPYTVFGDTIGWYYLDNIDSMVTDTARYGAFDYAYVTADFSPAVFVKLTGNKRNKVGGSGSIWILRWFQEIGQAIKQ